MTPDLFWIPGPWPGRLAITNRPRGGDWLQDEIAGLHSAGVEVLVSLLEAEEERELQLRQEASLAKLRPPALNSSRFQYRIAESQARCMRPLPSLANSASPSTTGKA